MREHSQEFKEQHFKTESASEVVDLPNLVKAAENIVSSALKPLAEKPGKHEREKKVSAILNFNFLVQASFIFGFIVTILF